MNWKLKIGFLSGILLVTTAADDPRVCITDGCLLGIKEVSRSGREFNSFLGIPYAKPPLGDLRFRSPEKPVPWDILEAKKDGPICPQSIFFRQKNGPMENEDCLRLNVFTPKIPRAGESINLPVIVWLHPGGWMFWSGTRDYFGGNYLLDREVVVVSINYRLNVLGFLSTEDDAAHGNWALKDQTHALRWVRDNIASFGGNPESVTIMGQSAGGASGHYHMMSPLSRGLFHRVIAQSGNALAPWAFSCAAGEAREHALRLAMHLNCSVESSKVLVECLRAKTTEELLAGDTIFLMWYIHPEMPFQPVVEKPHRGAFLLAPPEELIRQGRLADVPLMTGICVKEGAVGSAGLIPNKTLLEDMQIHIHKSFPAMLMYYNARLAQRRKITGEIREFYFDDRNITSAEITGLTDMMSDRHFTFPLSRTLELQRKCKKNPTFAYIFEYRGSNTFAGIFGDPVNDYNGTVHSDELIYLFPLEKTFFNGSVRNAEENAMVERMLDLWTNFAKHGDPTPEEYDIEWRPVADHEEHLAIRAPNDLPIESYFYRERVAFWKKLKLERLACPVRGCHGASVSCTND